MMSIVVYRYMKNLTFGGFLLGLAIIGVIVLVIVIILKASKKKSEKLKETVSPEILEQISRMPVPWEQNRNFFIAKGYISEIKEDKDRFSVTLLYNWIPEGRVLAQLTWQNISLDRQKFFSLGIKQGDIVTTLHNSHDTFDYTLAGILCGAEETKRW